MLMPDRCSPGPDHCGKRREGQQNRAEQVVCQEAKAPKKTEELDTAQQPSPSHKYCVLTHSVFLPTRQSHHCREAHHVKGHVNHTLYTRERAGHGDEMRPGPHRAQPTQPMRWGDRHDADEIYCAHRRGSSNFLSAPATRAAPLPALRCKPGLTLQSPVCISVADAQARTQHNVAACTTHSTSCVYCAAVSCKQQHY